MKYASPNKTHSAKKSELNPVEGEEGSLPPLPTYIEFDGQPIQIIKKQDLNQDGQIDAVETFNPYQRRGETEIRTTTETGESLKELNQDTLDEISNMSSIDMRSRINNLLFPPILGIDSLVSLKVLPPECLFFTRKALRLMVSMGGQGRKEMVNTIIGQREHQQQDKGMFSQLLGLKKPPQ